MNDVIREFLLETHENLAQLDADLIALEKDPAGRDTLARAFRTLHTVKGTAGFLGYVKLQAVAHSAEHLLSKLRAGELAFNQPIATALLGVVDAIRQVLAAVEVDGTEGAGEYSELIAVLDALRDGVPAKPPQAVSTPGEGALAGPPSQDPLTRRAVAPRISTATSPPQSRGRGEEPPPPPPPAPLTPVPAPSLIAPQPDAEQKAAVADTSLRVDVGLLDKLMTLVGELVLARNQIVQFSSSQENSGFLGTVQRLNLLTSELQASVMKTRMQPIGNVWSKFPRVVRDLAVACGKKVRFEMEGQETELDKTIVESIRDPLTHIVRNAVDHGIEKPETRTARGKPAEGRLSLRAYHEGGKVLIEIVDDGGGIDPVRVRDKAVRTKLIAAEDAMRMSERDLVNLVFLPGFSTAEQVTHFSGRGVGMDVVRTNVEKIGGTVDLESVLGRGTTVRMKIPLTLAIIPALTVTSAGERFCIPQVSLVELVHLDAEVAAKGIESMHGAPVYRLRGHLLPIVYLDEQLGLHSTRVAADGVNIVVLQAEDRQFGLVVDAIHDTEEIVVKPLQKQLKGIAVFAGATIMGDGRVALILDILGLAHRSSVVSGGRARGSVEKETAAAETASDRESLLVFVANGGERMAIPLTCVARLEEFAAADLEWAGTRRVVQYRGEILPLLDTSRELRRLARGGRTGRKDPALPIDRKTQVVVCSGLGKQVGLIVDRIVDIADEAIASRRAANRPGVRFVGVVQDSVTEFPDVDALIRATEPNTVS
ncbi:MAG: chemotaxis protein CheA [Gemmataceae bacterium]